MMRFKGVALVAAVILAMMVQVGGTQRGDVQERVFPLAGSEGMRYALSVPAGYDASDPRPLILALHPGGANMPYYGGAFMRQVVEPALRSWNPIIVAPDAPTRAWTSATSEQAVMALLEDIVEEYGVDPDRILVTGFSLGGRGTWFMATRHPEFFTGAMPIAGSPGGDSLESLKSMPVHIIHSVDDGVVPIEHARAAAQALAGSGNSVKFTELEGTGHFAMGSYVGALKEAGEWMWAQWDDAGR